MSSTSDKAKFFDEKFPKSSSLYDSGISLLSFPSIANLKLHNTPVTPKLIKKIKTELWKLFGPDCMLMVVLNSFKPEPLYILADLFNMCLDDFFSPTFWKVLSVILFLSMFERGLQLKSKTLLVLFLRLVKSLKNI